MLFAQLLRVLCVPNDTSLLIIAPDAPSSSATSDRDAPSFVSQPPAPPRSMLTVYGAIVGLKPSALQRAKPITFHLALVVGVLLYAYLGGLVFHALESTAHEVQQQVDEAAKRACVLLILQNTSAATSFSSANSTSSRILECWHQEEDMRTEWSAVTATLYGFGVITTLGYNRISPITTMGRMFCIVYGLCGIPVAMIILANVGQYLNQFACKSRKRFEQYSDRRRRSKALIGDEGENNVELTSLMVLGVFLAYVALGAVLLPLLNGQFDFINGLYFNFLCLTAIDFGALVPKRVALLPITLTYVCIGLAITTLAIDVGSDYMKKLHYLGKKMKDAATTKIWFGGKSLRVRDLLHAVGKKWGVDPHEIDQIDLDTVVERAIAIQEGRPLPPDEPPPEVIVTDIQPPELVPLLEKDGGYPEFIDVEAPPLPSHSPPASDPPSSGRELPVVTYEPIHDVTAIPEPSTASQLLNDLEESYTAEFILDDQQETYSNTILPSPLSLRPTHELEQFPLVIEYPLRPVPELTHSPIELLRSQQIRILIDTEDEDPGVKQFLAAKPENSPDVTRRASLPPPQYINRADLDDNPIQSAPESSMTSPLEPTHETDDDREATDEFHPKRFKEKKEMYGRDPRKLFETYQEEWERLERLNAKRTGGRRKSILSLH